MATSIPPSLFPGRTLAGSEILFRSICAIGWAAEKNLRVLRYAADSHDGDGPLRWIRFLEDEVLHRFNPDASDAHTWLRDVRKLVRNASELSDIRKIPRIASWLRKLAFDLRCPEASDPQAQLESFNRLGFALAAKMIGDPSWSAESARSRWTLTDALPFGFGEDREGNFKPVTTRGATLNASRIELRVYLGQFERTNAILFYLTLEYQFMHEYISHVLPTWQCGDLLEEEYLLAVMSLYYKSQGPDDGILPLLVAEADIRKAGNQRERREFVKTVLAPRVGESRLSQLLLELATLDEQEMSLTDKYELLGLLNQLPPADQNLKRTIWLSLQTEELDTIHQELKGRLREGHPKLRILDRP